MGVGLADALSSIGKSIRGISGAYNCCPPQQHHASIADKVKLQDARGGTKSKNETGFVPRKKVAFLQDCYSVYM